LTEVTDAHREHRPVMLEACIEGLAIRRDGVYVDGTFGRGGHSAGILARLGADGRLISLDRDPEAIAAGRRWGDNRFEIVHARFSDIGDVLDERGIARVDGVLLDLGVSSPQLDDPARGFSFRNVGPLDMRMDPTRGMSAREWLLGASETEIAEALKGYGEERFAVPIAKAIAARRRDAGSDAFRTTAELAAVVASVVRSRQKKPAMGKDPATRTFQAIRILVNQELEELALFLDRVVDRLKPGARLAVIAFHSLEDRIVKQFIDRESGRLARRDPITGAAVHDVPPRLRRLPKRLSTDAEAAANPRARSAVLRLAERL
jgi:16S rRNA (cytosine1402-N4)-methyltransferase